MNVDKEILQARIAHVEALLREAMDEAQQKGIEPIIECFCEMADAQDVGYCILEAYRAKHGKYPYRGLLTYAEEFAIRAGWDDYHMPDTPNLGEWYDLGRRLRLVYNPKTVEQLKNKLRERQAAS